MNYIKLINQFWQLRRSKRITNLQADLYFFLVQECNQRDWENPFECSNKIIIAGIDVAMSSLQDARNRLQQLGLIEFKAGQKNQANPVYCITECIADNRQYFRNSGGDTSGDTSGTAPVIPPEHISTKLNKNKTKRKHSAGGKPPAAKKVTEFWDVLVKTWFDFYGKNFKDPTGQDATPIFNEVQGKHLKKICEQLKDLSEKSKFEWTQEYSCYCLNAFFQKAYNHDDWLRSNFELGNLLTKFNSIVNKNADGTSKDKPATGAAVSTSSILTKIASMPAPAGVEPTGGG